MNWPDATPWSRPDRNLNFSWVDKWVAGCKRPKYAMGRAWLVTQGIQTVVGIWEPNLGPSKHEFKRSGLTLARFPVEDYEAPTQQQLHDAIARINAETRRGVKVAVCCGYGEGRTGVLLTCYLISKGMDFDNALWEMKRLERIPYENREQREAIYDFGIPNRGVE